MKLQEEQGMKLQKEQGMESKEEQAGSGEVYEIRIQGKLHSRWLHWFDGFTLTNLEDSEILLRGTIIDQAALHGTLAQIRDLNLKLISVNRVKP